MRKREVRPVVASAGDVAAWLALAAEVEALFGEPTPTDPSFVRFLLRNIERATACVVREEEVHLVLEWWLQ